MPAPTLPTRPSLHYSADELAGLMRLACTRRDAGLVALTLQHVVGQGVSLSSFRESLSPSDRIWFAETLTRGGLSVR